MGQRVSSFRDLAAWQRAVELSVAVHRLTESFPRHERFGLAQELRKTSRSVAYNVAEGHQRHTTREYLRFLDIALGSQAELETQLRIAAAVGYLRSEEPKFLLTLCDEVGRLLRGLSKALEHRGAADPRCGGDAPIP
ncbi:MAG TPA: four helix bundle protein [Thermoanaerobaculales bacterium]|nr:four helix bundle protein [Thermoanaerobaculales bacterium]HPA80158.1 four helix bundle protein [Thermoanaerobaculales bacterium]HQL31318.1 four helix bundle protein [Thermoanaerobaculales bacterium]HQN94763.1 four helix bundle protein [Thermoanaerobaculales bacterium]HQP42565.1 four helix bundle protein [Thermoanaerobaculales bacterium]